MQRAVWECKRSAYGREWLSRGFQTAVSHWVRRIQSKLVLSSWPKSWVSLLKWDFLGKSQSAFLRNEGTQLSFQSHQNLLVLMSLEPFLQWLLACPCSQFVKAFPLFSWCYVEPPSIPQKTTCRGQLCFKVKCKSSELFSSGLLPLLAPHLLDK